MDLENIKSKLLAEKDRLEGELKDFREQDPYLSEDRGSEVHSFDNDSVEDEAHDRIEGTPLEIDWPESELPKTMAEDLTLPIVYENGDFLVIDKPAGLVVHPGSGHTSGTVVNALLQHLGKKESRDERFGVVHRLDKDTSGLLLLAKIEKTERDLKQLFKDHQVTKEYLALVRDRKSTRLNSSHSQISYAVF